MTKCVTLLAAAILATGPTLMAQDTDKKVMGGK